MERLRNINITKVGWGFAPEIDLPPVLELNPMRYERRTLGNLL